MSTWWFSWVDLGIERCRATVTKTQKQQLEPKQESSGVGIQIAKTAGRTFPAIFRLFTFCTQKYDKRVIMTWIDCFDLFFPILFLLFLVAVVCQYQ